MFSSSHWERIATVIQKPFLEPTHTRSLVGDIWRQFFAAGPLFPASAHALVRKWFIPRIAENCLLATSSLFTFGTFQTPGTYHEYLEDLW